MSFRFVHDYCFGLFSSISNIITFRGLNTILLIEDSRSKIQEFICHMRKSGTKSSELETF